MTSSLSLGFRALDLSFVGPDDGWALGTAPCASRPRHRCAAMRRTIDGGNHWTPLRPPSAEVPEASDCAVPCVLHVRFATNRSGYAFGPGAFFTTADGGRHWTRRPGGAEALESLDGNVIRVRPVPNDCTLGCTYAIETAPIGSMRWRPRERIWSYQVTLARGGSDAYLLAIPHFSGSGPSTMYRSSDGGASWQMTPHPCRDVGGYRGVAVAAGPVGRVSLLCEGAGPRAGFLAVSSDSGAQWHAAGGTMPFGAVILRAALAGDSRTFLLATRADNPGRGRDAFLSADGGRTWHPVPGVTGAVIWVGVESTTVGRIISDNGRRIWTTNDAGAHWTPFIF